MKSSQPFTQYLKIFFLVHITSFLTTSIALADGKFLRGEKWQPFSLAGNKADFYVAPDGNDAWSGTLPTPDSLNADGPFATLARARQAVQMLKNQVYTAKKQPVEKRYIGSSYPYGDGKDILVLIRGGYYSLDKPLEFGPTDGGERCETEFPSGAFEFHKLKDFFVTYAAYPGETPIISGGKKVTLWQKEKGKWVTSIENMEIVKLIANDKVQNLARTPNEGYFTPAEMPTTTTEFKFRPGDLKNWPGMAENKIHLILRWHEGLNSIAKVDETKQLAYLAESQKGLTEVPPRYYVENIEALLDAPGEWYFNRKLKKLSYLPQKDIMDPNQATIIAPVLSTLVILTGETDRPVRNLRFYGLTFEATNSGSNAISFEYAKNCELVDSKIQNVGGIAVFLSKGCYQNRILKNTILAAEAGGIAVAGNPHPENWQDVVRENIVSYNYVADCGGISIGAHNTLFTTLSHNEITRTRGRYAMNVGGWSNVEEAVEGGYRVEYNHLHQILDGADDSGAITCSGLTYDSIIRYNLIHDVIPGFFNDNVAFWFDNMSSGWIVADNIYYNLKQAEMKLCACDIVDNTYRDNFLIETPQNTPEGIIAGAPRFEYNDLQIESADGKDQKHFSTGQLLTVSAIIKNTGATGIQPVDFYVDGKVVASKKFPVIHHNMRKISFDFRFYDPGPHQVAIGSAPYKTIHLAGDSLTFLLNDLNLSKSIVPSGAKVTVTVDVKNVKNYLNTINLDLYLNEIVIASKIVSLVPAEAKLLKFDILPEKGIHEIKIGYLPPIPLMVYPHHPVAISDSDLLTYCSGTAKPCEFDIDQQINRFTIIASGSDFYHAEDSYGAIYLKKAIKGNFSATVKISEFGENVTEWFRTGIFVRNDLSASYETEPGSMGSVLMFTSPLRFGIQWDEHGDGCMHKAISRNHDRIHLPIWLKLERHGDQFSGHISYDGSNWINSFRTTIVPGLAESMDLGLAAGANDQKQSRVVFEDFTLEVEEEGWRE